MMDELYHVGVSGGKDSAAALLFMVHESGIPREKIRATFVDIGNDHEWTIQHVKMLSENVHPINIIKPDQDFFELTMQKKRFPSAKARFCTEFLKIIPATEVVQSLRKEAKRIVAVSGVRADESEGRSKLPEWDFSGNLLCEEWRPLLKWSIADVYAIHTRHNIPLNPLYALGARRVGCWPCVMSRKSEIRMIARKFPERIDAIRNMEAEMLKRNGVVNTFFHAMTVPPRFRTTPYIKKDGTQVMVCGIDDVVRWSMTGHRAKGSWDSNPEHEPIGCNSGYCE